jgi:hypothetical protein
MARTEIRAIVILIAFTASLKLGPSVPGDGWDGGGLGRKQVLRVAQDDKG